MNIEKSIELLKEFKKTGFHTLMIKYNEDRIHTNKLIEEAIETLLTAYEKEKRLAEANLKDSEEFQDNMCNHRCSKKCNEIKQKIDSISGLDDDWIYGNLLALESQVNVIVKSIEKYADEDKFSKIYTKCIRL